MPGPPSPSIRPYPWDFLERVPKRALGLASAARRRFRQTVDLGRLGAALGSLVASDVAIVPGRAVPVDGAPDPAGTIHLTASDGASVALELDADLATLVLSRALAREPGITAPGAPLDASLRGALAALAIEAARRTGGHLPLRARSDAMPPGPALCLDVTVLVDERPYGARAWIRVHDAPTRDARRAADLGALGEVPIAVPVVAAVSRAARTDVGALRAGDVWLPGEGWLSRGAPIDGAGADVAFARAALAGPLSERGVELGRSASGRLVLRSNVIALSADPGEPGGASTVGGAGSTTMNDADADETLTEMVLDAPVVVRVEIGSVTLAAREWAEIHPGDVLETGVRVGEPVVLRIAGQEVARGELVNVDGELGVRIRELVAAGREPSGRIGRPG